MLRYILSVILVEQKFWKYLLTAVWDCPSLSGAYKTSLLRVKKDLYSRRTAISSVRWMRVKNSVR